VGDRVLHFHPLPVKRPHYILAVTDLTSNFFVVVIFGDFVLLVKSFCQTDTPTALSSLLACLIYFYLFFFFKTRHGKTGRFPLTRHGLPNTPWLVWLFFLDQTTTTRG
jgi:hypothetical protein